MHALLLTILTLYLFGRSTNCSLAYLQEFLPSKMYWDTTKSLSGQGIKSQMLFMFLPYDSVASVGNDR